VSSEVVEQRRSPTKPVKICREKSFAPSAMKRSCGPESAALANCSAVRPWRRFGSTMNWQPTATRIGRPRNAIRLGTTPAKPAMRPSSSATQEDRSRSRHGLPKEYLPEIRFTRSR